MRKILFIIYLSLFGSAILHAQPKNEFLYGISMYPELETWDQTLKSLDYIQKAKMNVVRFTESSWGNIEVADGVYDFTWVRRYLDELQKRGIKAILGTGSYIAPQWLFEMYPDMNIEIVKGLPNNSFGRKAACIYHPGFREAMRKYIERFASEFKDHPAIIGWQLDNEIDNIFGKRDYNKFAVQAFTKWLKQEYGTIENFNAQLKLREWGLSVNSFEQINISSIDMESGLPQIQLLYHRFQRDGINDLFEEQKAILRKYYKTQWVTTDVMATNYALDTKLRNTLDFIGFNFYPPSQNEKGSYNWWAKQFLYSRDIKTNHFMIAETRIGVAGATSIWDPVMTPEQFKTIMLLPVAFGSNGLMYWTGTRNCSGHWPLWGGLFDWTGEPEPDFQVATELGEIYKKWSEQLTQYSVSATVGIIYDYEQTMINYQYGFTPKKLADKVVSDIIACFNQTGIGLDALSAAQVTAISLEKYKCLIIPATLSIGNPELTQTLKKYVEKGGKVIIAPLTNYMTIDGVFSNRGFCKDFQELTGGFVQTIRMIKAYGDNGKTPQQVVFNNNRDTLNICEGFCEIADKSFKATTLAKFRCNDFALNNTIAMSENTIGKGKVYKAFFWPEKDCYKLIQNCIEISNPFFEGMLPEQIIAVPRTDNSMFISNTYYEPCKLKLKRDCLDRISNKKLVKGTYELLAYQTLWLE